MEGYSSLKRFNTADLLCLFGNYAVALIFKTAGASKMHFLREEINLTRQTCQSLSLEISVIFFVNI